MVACLNIEQPLFPQNISLLGYPRKKGDPWLKGWGPVNQIVKIAELYFSPSGSKLDARVFQLRLKRDHLQYRCQIPTSIHKEFYISTGQAHLDCCYTQHHTLQNTWSRSRPNWKCLLEHLNSFSKERNCFSCKMEHSTRFLCRYQLWGQRVFQVRQFPHKSVVLPRQRMYHLEPKLARTIDMDEEKYQWCYCKNMNRICTNYFLLGI